MSNSSKRLVLRKDYERIVFGEVYIPLRADTYGTTMTKEEVRDAAYNFMREGRSHKIDVMHSWEESGCYAVQSFLARENDPDGFLLDAWVLAVKVEPDHIWDQVIRGDLNGFSIGAHANKTPEVVHLVTIKEIEVQTEYSEPGLFPPHAHYIHAEFHNGRIIPTWTSEELGHWHAVYQETAVEQNFEHGHRFQVLE